MPTRLELSALRRNPWLMGWIALVAVVFLVNATMVTLAIVTNPGLVVDDYYVRGQATEQELTSRAATAAQWTTNLDIPPDLIQNTAVTLRFFIVDTAGQPVTPETVTLYNYRPAAAKRDFALPMVAEAPGRYAATLSYPLVGVWDVLVGAKIGDDQVHVSHRIAVIPHTP